MEKNIKIKIVYMYIMSHFAVQQRSAQHCKSSFYISIKKRMSFDFRGNDYIVQDEHKHEKVEAR